MKPLIGLIFALIIFSLTAFAQPAQLRDTANQYDYVVITIPEFVQTCASFKEHKQNVRHMRVAVVDTAQIYNEFPEYNGSVEKIQGFINYAAARWRKPAPKYFLLAGDLNKIPNWSRPVLPGYPGTDTACSDYFYMINPLLPDSIRLTYSVGRIAARTSLELFHYFNKVVNYETDTYQASWKNNFVFVASDGTTPNNNDGEIYELTCLELQRVFPMIMKKKIIFQNVKSFYYGNKDSIISFLNNPGASGIILIGRGTPSYFTWKRMLALEDMSLIHNRRKYFMIYTYFRQPFSADTIGSMAEACILSEIGAIGGLLPAGTTFLSDVNYLIKSLLAKQYREHLSIGEAWIKIAPLSYLSWTFNISGDPSLVINNSPIASTGGETGAVIKRFLLAQNYPNPFNPSTVVKYETADAGYVTLKIYDVLGKQAAVLVNEYKPSGSYSVEWQAGHLPSGVYLCELRCGSNREVKKMILQK